VGDGHAAQLEIAIVVAELARCPLQRGRSTNSSKLVQKWCQANRNAATLPETTDEGLRSRREDLLKRLATAC
jgi:hypothetical protein